ncbi:MAG TPA: type I-C CRISPR-associated protein Cas8c/Csd1 [Longimicrobium sp.]|nr:type I-C CRISPR-associated protein Cas8c/Csd1 [Longimicrobium sp.]
MILEALHHLAEVEELVPDPAFEMKPVAWLVHVADGARYSIEGTLSVPPSADGKRKPKPQPKSFRVPRQPIRTSGDLAFFFCDKAEYALGVDPSTDPEKKRAPEKLAGRFQLFREQVEECARATGDKGAAAVAALLDGIASGEVAVKLPPECEPNHLFAFVYAPDIDRLVHDRPAVREFWTKRRGVAGQVDSDSELRCMITGEPVGEAVNFPQLKYVPGGSASGISLVSFNANAFESHGWRGNENAPISRDAAEAAATALNRLLHPAYPDPRAETLGQPLPRRNVRLTGDTVVCYWAADPGAEASVDVIAALLEGDEGVVGDLYRSIWDGKEVFITDPTRFYALTLTGTQGRAIVRDWFESTVADVLKNLSLFFGALNVARGTPVPKGKQPPSSWPLKALLGSIAQRGGGDLPDALVTACLRAAFAGTRLPLSLLQNAVERARAEIGRSDWGDLYRRDLRAALIKAVLIRTCNYSDLRPQMDPNNTNAGYLLGRLMAVLERLQQTALGNVNATVVDRFFSAASATPQAVFPRLLKNARHHARKAADAGDEKIKRTAGWLEGQIDQILSPIGARKPQVGSYYTGFPAYLPLDQQGLFVLGYHQQRHWLWLPKETREALERDAGSAAVDAG